MPLADLFRRKSANQVLAEAEGGGGLKRSLGAFDLTLLGIGAIIGAGLFGSIKDMVTGTPVVDGAGPAVVLSYTLTAIVCGVAALCYAEIAAMVPVAGSAYSYSYVAFGELIAWIIGWDLIIEYAIGNIYVAQTWADHLQRFLHGMFGWQLPPWLALDFQSAAARVAADPTLASDFPTIGGHVVAVNVPAAFITIVLTIILYLGVKESARFNAVMVVLKVGLILAFIGIGLFHIDARHWTDDGFAPHGLKGIWQAAAIGFFSYIGFDAVSTAAEETRNPQRDIPRGMIWSLVVCTVLYIATAAVLTGIVPWKALSTHDPLPEAFARIGLTGASTALAFGAVIAMTAVLLVFQLGQTRIFYAMARDGLLPRVFSKIHPKHRTPHINTWVVGIFVAIMCSLLTPEQAIGLCNIGTLFAFALVSIGVIVLRVREPHRPRPFKIPGYPVTPIVSALACVGLILGLERSNWARFGIWLLLGLAVYLGYGFWNSRARRRA